MSCVSLRIVTVSVRLRIAAVSVWHVHRMQHFPLKDRYVQNPKPQPADLIAKGYLAADGSVVDNYYIAYYGA